MNDTAGRENRFAIEAHLLFSVVSLEQALMAHNPVASALVEPGTADELRSQFASLAVMDDPGVLRRALDLFDAWLAFFRGDIERAREVALALFYDVGLRESMLSSALPSENPSFAHKVGASYLICCLARYGIERAHTEAALDHLRNACGHDSHISQTAELCLAMYELSLGIVSDVPQWVRNRDLGAMRVDEWVMFRHGGVRPQDLHAATLASIQYATYTGDHEQALERIDWAQEVLGMRGHLIVDLYLTLYRAVNYEALGFVSQAAEQIRMATKLAEPDGLWQPVSEFVSQTTGPFIRAIEEVSPDGARRCRQLATGFMDRVRESHLEEQQSRRQREAADREQAARELADEVLIEARGLVVEYPHGAKAIRVLKGVDIDIHKGMLTIIFGESGCGKTSLLNVLGGMLTPTAGTLLFEGHDNSCMSAREKTKFRRDHVGFVFQHYNLIADLTAIENVETAAALVRDAHDSQEMLGLVGLGNKAHAYPRQMSGGEQQRVCIARALVKGAQILLCDEPTGALDSTNAKNVMAILQRLAKEQHTAVVVVTHNSLLASIADHLVTMRDGQIVDDTYQASALLVEQAL